MGKRFNEVDYKKLEKNIEKANKRIVAIQNRYGDRAWATNQLYEKIDTKLVKAINKQGLITINPNMKIPALRKVEVATNEFLRSKTSKLTGIEEVKRDVKRSLKTRFGTPQKPMSWRDINKLYDLVEDKNKRDITEKIGASDIWFTLDQAREQNLKFDKYFDLLNDRSSLDIKDPKDVEFVFKTYLNYTKRSKKEVQAELEIIKNKLGIDVIL